MRRECAMISARARIERRHWWKTSGSRRYGRGSLPTGLTSPSALASSGDLPEIFPWTLVHPRMVMQYYGGSGIGFASVGYGGVGVMSGAGIAREGVDFGSGFPPRGFPLCHNKRPRREDSMFGFLGLRIRVWTLVAMVAMIFVPVSFAQTSPGPKAGLKPDPSRKPNGRQLAPNVRLRKTAPQPKNPRQKVIDDLYYDPTHEGWRCFWRSEYSAALLQFQLCTKNTDFIPLDVYDRGRDYGLQEWRGIRRKNVLQTGLFRRGRPLARRLGAIRRSGEPIQSNGIAQLRPSWKQAKC